MVRGGSPVGRPQGRTGQPWRPWPAHRTAGRRVTDRGTADRRRDVERALMVSMRTDRRVRPTTMEATDNGKTRSHRLGGGARRRGGPGGAARGYRDPDRAG